MPTWQVHAAGGARWKHVHILNHQAALFESMASAIQDREREAEEERALTATDTVAWAPTAGADEAREGAAAATVPDGRDAAAAAQMQGRGNGACG